MTSPRTLDTALSLTKEKHNFIRHGGELQNPTSVAQSGGPESPPSSLPPGRQPLVPLTTRITQQTAQSLRRAYLQQKLSGQLPDTQQEIVEEAMRQWLSAHGFLDESKVP